jgi:hypothetical protein
MNPTDTPRLDLAGITHARERADLAAKGPGALLIEAVLLSAPETLPPAVRLAREALVRAAWATAEADVRREENHGPHD